ncbi:MAG: SMEK domain-containing protein [Rhodospirillaceae bacterium]|nr:SMEK domain-containing protein [Rhodospirillaceae bacterium]
MKHTELLNQFREELAQLSHEVETSVAMSHLDVNRICEDVFCGIFKELFGFLNLRNLNHEEKQYYPGIDLADDEARVAIQITSDKSLKKIKDSITTTIQHGLHQDYDRIIFYILTRKQSSYSQRSIANVCSGHLSFDTSSDILDFTDLASRAANVEPKKLKRSVDILGSYMRGCDVGLAEQDFDPPKEPPETLVANLVEVSFPRSLYIAELLPEVFGGRKKRYERKAVGEYVRSVERIVPSDYVVHSNKLITFHNLEESDNAFDFLVDEGTVEPFDPSEYFSIDDNYERVFKSLLRFCLQQKLYRHRVLWDHGEGIFKFMPLEDIDNVRRINWTGRKKATRTVFERKFNRNHPEKVLSMRHFAFAVTFQIVAGTWYMSITPDWLFSYGKEYLRSAYGDKLTGGLKRMEKNRSVFDQFRFLCSWLNELDSDDLFAEGEDFLPQLTFGQIFELSGSRYLNEDLWEPLTVAEEDNQIAQRRLGFL